MKPDRLFLQYQASLNDENTVSWNTPSLLEISSSEFLKKYLPNILNKLAQRLKEYFASHCSYYPLRNIFYTCPKLNVWTTSEDSWRQIRKKPNRFDVALHSLGQQFDAATAQRSSLHFSWSDCHYANVVLFPEGFWEVRQCFWHFCWEGGVSGSSRDQLCFMAS